jgi:hypothetical protein
MRLVPDRGLAERHSPDSGGRTGVKQEEGNTVAIRLSLNLTAGWNPLS